MIKEEIKRKRIRHYFTKFPKWTILAIIIGIITLVIGVGIILIIAGIIGIYSDRKKRPTDEQIDKWLLDEDLEELKKRALEKLGIDPEEQVKTKEPFRIASPVLWWDYEENEEDIYGVDINDLVFKQGKDKCIRFGVYNVTIIQLTEKLMGIYRCTYNFLKNVPLNEKTDEYFYEDIVAVSTREISTSDYVLPNRKKLKHAEAFAITIPSGDAVEVILWSPILEKYTGGKPKLEPMSMAENTIAAIRKLLREKNNSGT